MKMKGVLVIALLVLGCSSASAQSFGFSSGGGPEICNYEVLHQLEPYDVWEGEDNLSLCGIDHNATIVGVSVKLSRAGNPAGFKLMGVAYADNIYDAFSGFYTGEQWFMITNLTCSNKKGPFGWIGFVSLSGVLFGDNYGWLTCYIPGRNGVPAGHRLSIGTSIPVKK